MNNPATGGIRRGEVYWLDFASAMGSEMTGLHPCLIIQNDIGNQTSNLRVASLPVGVFLKAGEGGLPRDCVVHCGHIYTVDKKRLRTRLGQLIPVRRTEVDRALVSSFGL